jgi:hypothetical protein
MTKITHFKYLENMRNTLIATNMSGENDVIIG